MRNLFIAKVLIVALLFYFLQLAMIKESIEIIIALIIIGIVGFIVWCYKEK